jgi:polyisoprenoid-binding protein YceI
MGIADGSYQVGPQNGRLLVKTSRTGLGSKAGHDLTIEVTRWHGQVVVDAANLANCSVAVEVDVDSLAVREGTGGIMPLTDGDRADILKTLQGKILNTRQHPTITFSSTQVSGTAEAFRVDGDLTIVGVTQPVSVAGQAAADRVTGSAVVVQSRFGIRPYSAFLGALRLRDEVEIQFDLALPAEG